MDYRFRRCLDKRKIVKVDIDNRRIRKEYDSAVYDLRMAGDSFERKDFKWATVKAYYAMFHLAKGLLFSKGYREKTHFCLMVALKELFIDRGKLHGKHLKNFEDAMSLREEADYESKFSEAGAAEIIENAKGFLNNVKDLLK